MRKIVENIKQKPEHHRKLISVGVSALIVGVMAMVWVTTLPMRFAKLNDKVDEQNSLKASVFEAFSPDAPRAEPITSQPTASSITTFGVPQADASEPDDTDGVEISDTVEEFPE